MQITDTLFVSSSKGPAKKQEVCAITLLRASEVLLQSVGEISVAYENTAPQREVTIFLAVCSSVNFCFRKHLIVTQVLYVQKKQSEV